MKKLIELKNPWEIKDITPVEKLSIEEVGALCDLNMVPDTGWIKAAMPQQVHEILLDEGIIEDPALFGKAKECLWVAEKDWVYRCAFDFHERGSKVRINFKGLDTLADIYLNGEYLACNNDMYLPLKLDVTGKLRTQNTLVLHFHSPHEYLKTHKFTGDWARKIRPHRIIRKCDNDFTGYLGAKPYLTRIGIYDKVVLEVIDEMEIVETDISSKLLDGYARAEITVNVKGSGCMDGSRLSFVANAPDGQSAAESSCPIICCNNGDWEHTCVLSVDNPQLWWPRGYGNHPLYEVNVLVVAGGEVKDRNKKLIGFREVRMEKPFDFIINNRRIKLWGAQPAPINGITHRWDNEKSNRILDLAENCNMNAQRIWGASDRYDDEYYNETDRRGILVWQEFFHNYGAYPNSMEYRELYKKEAEFQIKRLKHHPSLLFWCGGNECFMGAEYDFPGEDYIGSEIFLEDYKKTCELLDPDRYFHINSPWGGAFANDPLEGDTHSYTNTWYVPGADYPVMIAEEIRTAPPSVKSFVRYLEREKLWPENYSGIITKDDKYPWPDSWTELTSTFGWRKIPPIELFYDSNDLESAVYKFGAAQGFYLRKILENNRRGKPSEKPEGERICKGHFVCRWNDSWPIIYGSMLDYFLEPYIPYYSVKRAYEPILISFDIQNFIYAWVVNDSPYDVEGSLFIKLFDPRTNSFVKEKQLSVFVASGESRLITNLNDFKQFSREYILYSYLTDIDGNIITRTNDFVDIEKHLHFPDAKLDVQLEGGILQVTADKFARCVELSGDDEGDEFGWVFEDNYFDLVPGEVKKVKISGRHKGGVITAKPYYSKFKSRIEFVE